MSTIIALLVCASCRARVGRCIPGQILAPTAAYLQTRGKKGQREKRRENWKKEPSRRIALKEERMQEELRQVMEVAALRAAEHGEPLDPEMLNPSRRRLPAPVSREERERRFLLVKEYSRFCMQRHKEELGLLQAMVRSRERALLELKQVSVSLYKQTMKLNRDLFPFECTGPTATPPIPQYQPPELED